MVGEAGFSALRGERVNICPEINGFHSFLQNVLDRSVCFVILLHLVLSIVP